MKSEEQATSIESLNTNKACNPLGAYLNAQARSDEAVENNPEFFQSEAHQAKIQDVVTILDNFFGPDKKVYITHRGNKGKPFTSVKLSKHKFPAVSQRTKEEQYRKPLQELGVEIKFSPRTNSYLYYVK